MNIAPPPSPYFSSRGPMDGPICSGESPRVLDVIAFVSGSPTPIGVAYEMGHVVERDRPVATWKLALGSPLPGKFVCVGRIFVPVDE